MGSAAVREAVRDTAGCFDAAVLQAAWSAIPAPLRTTDLDSTALGPQELAAFNFGTQAKSFHLHFDQLPAPLDREIAWCCHRIVELGGRVVTGQIQTLIRWLARVTEDQPELRGSMMAGTPRQWERAIATAFARHEGRLPGKNWLQNTGATVRRCHQMLWSIYDQRPWWQREVWDPTLDPRIPRRPHEPSGDHNLYFQHLHPQWLRLAAQWYLKVSLETGDLTWTTARSRRSGLQVFGDWISGLDPVPPPWLRADPAGVRLFMLDFLGHVRAQKARSGPNRGKPLSALRVNDIVTDVEKFYAPWSTSRRSRPGR